MVIVFVFVAAAVLVAVLLLIVFFVVFLDLRRFIRMRIAQLLCV